MRICSVLVAVASVAACAAGPNYRRPETHTPPTYAAIPAGAAPAATPVVDPTRWWRALNDQELDSLIERAIKSNPDLEIALARLQAARTFESAVVGRALPTVVATAGGGKGTGTDLARGRAGPGLVSADTTRGLSQVSELAGFEAVWELDVFGRYRREIQAAHYDTQAQLAARNAVLLTIVADVARAYIDLRGLQTQAAVLRAGVKVLAESQRIADIRYTRGITNELDAVLAARELAALEARVAPVEAAVNAAEYTIATLLGQYPEDLVAELATPALVPGVPAAVNPGLPLDLLRRRPDIQQAEWDLAGGTARIGIATTNLFPRIAITGAIGYQRQGLGVSPTIGQHVWSAGPAAIWPLLDFGALDAEVEIANLETHALLVQYRRLIQAAVLEVDTAASALNADREQLSKLGEALVASQRAVTLATERYVRGLTDFLNVVDAQRQEYLIEEEYTTAQIGLGEQFVALYKGLGGGWEDYQELPPSYTPKPAIIAAFQRVLSHNDPLK
jgi:NodT family efflux transporter outer membrane factor (OMF) lipoprotein